MNKAIKYLFFSLAALLFMSCLQDVSPKGKVSIKLPGKSQSRKVVEVEKQYEQTDADYYLLIAKSDNLEYNQEIIGFPGDEIIFDDLEPGVYRINASAYKKLSDNISVDSDTLVAKSETATTTVEIGKESIVSLKMIPGKYTTTEDDGEPENPGDDTPVITDIIITLSDEVFDGLDFIPYELAQALALSENEKDYSPVGALFKMSFVLDGDKDNPTDPVPLLCSDQLSAFMPYWKTKATGDVTASVGPVPFTFLMDLSEDNELKVLDPASQNSITYKVSDDVVLRDLEVTIKYPATPKNPLHSYDASEARIPAFTGSAKTPVLNKLDFFEKPVVYKLIDGTTVSDEIKVTTRYPNTNARNIYFNTVDDNGAQYIQATPAPGSNQAGEAKVIQTAVLTPSEYAYYDSQDDLTRSEEFTVTVVPFTLSPLYNANFSEYNDKLTKGTYNLELVNDAENAFGNVNISWSCSADKEIISEPYTGMTSTYTFNVDKTDGETYSITCELKDEAGQVLLTLTKDIELAEAEEEPENPVTADYSARLKSTAENKDYIFADENGDLYALCTGCSENAKQLSAGDFELFYFDEDGAEKTVDFDNPDAYRVEIINSNWSVVGKNIPVTITRNENPDEVYTCEITLKRISKTPSLSFAGNGKSKLKISLNATGENYPVYKEDSEASTIGIDEISVEIVLTYKTNFGFSISLEPISLKKSGNNLEELFDFGSMNGMYVGDYTATISVNAYNADYADLFIPVVLTETITITGTSSEDATIETN